MPRPAKPWRRPGRDGWFAKIDGREVKLCAEADGFAAARRELARLKAGAARGLAVDRRLTVQELCDRYMSWAEGKIAVTTWGWYRWHLQSWIDSAGRVRAIDLKPLHVTAWLDAHPAWGPSMRRGAITCAKRVTSWATAEGHLDADPLKGVKRPAQGRRRALSEDEAARVLGAITAPAVRDFVIALLETGCRPGELIAVTAADLDATARTVRVVGKAGRRTVHLNDTAAALFARRAGERPDGPIFVNSKGRAWDRNAWRCAFRRVRAKVGIPHATAYSLRHTFASQAIARGVDSLLVAELMGHRDLDMLKDVYVHHRAETLQAAVKRATE